MVIGTVYALMGLGLTLIFGVMRVVNFAQGEFYMLGGYTAFYLITLAGVPWYLAIPLAMGITFAAGVAAEALLLRPTHDPKRPVEKPLEYALITTFALSVLMQKGALLLFGPFFKRPPDYSTMAVDLPFLYLESSLTVAVVASVPLILATTLLVGRTWRGRSWRALAQSQEAAKLMGVNVSKESTLAFGFSCALAAAAGALMAPVVLLSPNMGASALIKGYEIIAIGGLGSIPGSLAGGILLGVVETVGSAFVSGAYRDVVGFAVLILFLLVRPRGLFGQEA